MSECQYTVYLSKQIITKTENNIKTKLENTFNIFHRTLSYITKRLIQMTLRHNTQYLTQNYSFGDKAAVHKAYLETLVFKFN